MQQKQTLHRSHCSIFSRVPPYCRGTTGLRAKKCGQPAGYSSLLYRLIQNISFSEARDGEAVYGEGALSQITVARGDVTEENGRCDRQRGEAIRVRRNEGTARREGWVV